MCKVAGVTGINNENRDDVWLFMIALGDLMSRGNQDGIGYAAFDSENNIFGERWLINNTWFRDLSKDRRIKPNMLQNIYNFFGEKVKRNDAKSIILHTRAATTARGMKNTHPFVDDPDKPTTALIHNGMIYNHNRLKKVHSTCDSEVILHEYLNEKVNEDSTNLIEAAKKLQGWMTCLILAKDAEKKPVIDIFTDNGRLTSFWVPRLKVRVYSSMEEDIRRAAEILGVKVEKLERTAPLTFQRIDADSGEIMQEGEFEMQADNIIIAKGNFDDEHYLANWLESRGHYDV